MVPLFAGFWRRCAALLLDCLILYLLAVVILIAVAVGGWFPWGALPYLYVAIACAYFAGFHASARQATPGKRALGIKVTDLAGRRIGRGVAIGRFFMAWLSCLTLAIGYLAVAFTSKRQALHDILAATLVVNARARPEDVAGGRGVMPVTTGVFAAMFVPVGFVAIAAVVATKGFHDYEGRARIGGAMAAAESLKEEVGRALAQGRPFRTGSMPVESSWNAKGIEVASNGEIVVALPAALGDGVSIVFTPSIGPSGAVSWRCSARGVPASRLPAACRT